MMLEAQGWRLSFRRLGSVPRFLPLLVVRVCGDALVLGLPSGAVVSESVQPYLLKRRCFVPLETGIVATVARKFLVVLSHGLFLATGTLLAWPTARRRLARGDRPRRPAVGAPRDRPRPGRRRDRAVAATIGHGRVADRVHATLGALGGRWIGSWLERNARRFQRTDEALVAFFASTPPPARGSDRVLRRGLARPRPRDDALPRLVGAPIPLSTAMVIETALILVRAAAVPVPAGLGVQDAGYILCLKALGVPDATTVGAAFVLLKRGRDLFWILLGFVLMGVSRRRGEGALPAVPAGGA